MTQEQVIGEAYTWFLRLPPKSRARLCGQEVMLHLRDAMSHRTGIPADRVQEYFEEDAKKLPTLCV